MFELAALEGLIPAGGSLHFNLHLDVRVNDPSVLGQEGVTSVSENILNGTFTNGK